VARYDDHQPLVTATPCEHMERYAVPYLLEIGIPGLLYVALCSFFAGSFVRTFPSLSTTACGALGVTIDIRVLWSFEPVLDARLRPKPLPFADECAISTRIYHTPFLHPA